MNTTPRDHIWSGPRLCALAASALVLMIFVGANAHLIAVAYSSQPDCVPHGGSTPGGAVIHRAAKPSC